jgi:hypothetical protein
LRRGLFGARLPGQFEQTRRVRRPKRAKHTPPGAMPEFPPHAHARFHRPLPRAAEDFGEHGEARARRLFA